MSHGIINADIIQQGALLTLVLLPARQIDEFEWLVVAADDTSVQDRVARAIEKTVEIVFRKSPRRTSADGFERAANLV